MRSVTVVLVDRVLRAVVSLGTAQVSGRCLLVCGRADARTRPITHRLTLPRHLRSCQLEQRFRLPLPEDARRADAGAAQPRQASDQRRRM